MFASMNGGGLFSYPPIFASAHASGSVAQIPYLDNPFEKEAYDQTDMEFGQAPSP